MKMLTEVLQIEGNYTGQKLESTKKSKGKGINEVKQNLLLFLFLKRLV